MHRILPTMNALRKYLDRKNAPSSRALAKQVGVSHSSIVRYASGAVTPGLGPAYEMERVTRGAVPARSWARSRGYRGPGLSRESIAP